MEFELINKMDLFLIINYIITVLFSVYSLFQLFLFYLQITLFTLTTLNPIIWGIDFSSF